MIFILSILDFWLLLISIFCILGPCLLTTQHLCIIILTVSFTGQHKRLISSPPVAVFPHPLASDLSFSRYWKVHIGMICSLFVGSKRKSKAYSLCHNDSFYLRSKFGRFKVGGKKSTVFFTLNCWDVRMSHSTYFLWKKYVGYLGWSMKISKESNYKICSRN